MSFLIDDKPSVKKRPAMLALADGTIFRGYAFGADRGIDAPVLGEVVFNTSMYGYQEILTDPSYAGQILTFTYPHIGNVGWNEEDDESSQFYAEGLIIGSHTEVSSNFRAARSLTETLRRLGKMGIYGIDTRALVTYLRDRGAQMGAIAAGDRLHADDLVAKARAQGTMVGKDYVRQVACKQAYAWREGVWTLNGGYKEYREEQLWSRPHVVALDCGIKRNILRLLVDVGFRVTVLPAGSSSTEILAQKPDALFLSNGPGDPATLDYVVNPVKQLLGKVPIFGICLGHQILGQALGAKTYKLKFGHRGGNHPVLDYSTGKVEITVQNHGFAVDAAELKNRSSSCISHINLNDQTVEGIDARELKAFSVQYHPEASPGPRDSRYLFKRFFESVVG